MGHIHHSKSPWGGPIFLVKKKDGSWRLCTNYHCLNNVTIRNSYMLPWVDDLLDPLHIAKYFSKIDLKTSYHHIRIAENDIPKIAFRTHYGYYKFLVMPFGLTKALITFQQEMIKLYTPSYFRTCTGQWFLLNYWQCKNCTKLSFH